MHAISAENCKKLQRYGIIEPASIAEKINIQRIADLERLFPDVKNVTFSQDELIEFLGLTETGAFMSRFIQNFISKKLNLEPETIAKMPQLIATNQSNFKNNSRLFFRGIVLSKFQTYLKPSQWPEALTGADYAKNIFTLELLFKHLNVDDLIAIDEPTPEEWFSLLTSTHTYENIENLKIHFPFLGKLTISFKEWIATITKAPHTKKHIFLLKQAYPYLQPFDEEDETWKSIFAPPNRLSLLRNLQDFPMFQSLPLRQLYQLAASKHLQENLTTLAPYLEFLCKLNIDAAHWVKIVSTKPSPTKHVGLLKQAYPCLKPFDDADEAWPSLFELSPPFEILENQELARFGALSLQQIHRLLASNYTAENLEILAPYLDVLCALPLYQETWIEILTAMAYPLKHIVILRCAYPQLQIFDLRDAAWELFFASPTTVTQLSTLEHTAPMLELAKLTLRQIYDLAVSVHREANLVALEPYHKVLNKLNLSQTQWIESLTSPPSSKKHVGLLKQIYPFLSQYGDEDTTWETLFSNPNVLLKLRDFTSDTLPMFQKEPLTLQQLYDLAASRYCMKNLTSLTPYMSFLCHLDINQKTWIKILTSKNTQIKHIDILKQAYPYLKFDVLDDTWASIFELKPPFNILKNPLLPHLGSLTLNQIYRLLASVHTETNLENLSPYFSFLCSLDLPTETWIDILTTAPHPQKHVTMLKQAHPLLTIFPDEEETWQTIFSDLTHLNNFHTLILEHTLLPVFYIEQLTLNQLYTLAISPYRTDNMNNLEPYVKGFRTLPISPKMWLTVFTTTPQPNKHILILKHVFPLLHQYDNIDEGWQGVVPQAWHYSYTDLQTLLSIFSYWKLTLQQLNHLTLSNYFKENVQNLAPYFDFLEGLNIPTEVWIERLTTKPFSQKHIAMFKEAHPLLNQFNNTDEVWQDIFANASVLMHFHVLIVEQEIMATLDFEHMTLRELYNIALLEHRAIHSMAAPKNNDSVKRLTEKPQDVVLEIPHDVRDDVLIRDDQPLQDTVFVQDALRIETLILPLFSRENLTEEQWTVLISSPFTHENLECLDQVLPFLGQCLDAPELWIEILTSKPNTHKHLDAIRKIIATLIEDEIDSDNSEAYQAIFDDEAKQGEFIKLCKLNALLLKFKPQITATDLLELLNIPDAPRHLASLEQIPSLFRFDKTYVISLFSSQQKLKNIQGIIESQHKNRLIAQSKKWSLEQFDTVLSSAYLITNLNPLINFLKKFGFLQSIETNEFSKAQWIDMLNAEHTAANITSMLPYLAFWIALNPSKILLVEMITCSLEENINLFFLNQYIDLHELVFDFSDEQCNQIFSSPIAAQAIKKLDIKAAQEYNLKHAEQDPKTTMEAWVTYLLTPVDAIPKTVPATTLVVSSGKSTSSQSLTDEDEPPLKKRKQANQLVEEPLNQEASNHNEDWFDSLSWAAFEDIDILAANQSAPYTNEQAIDSAAMPTNIAVSEIIAYANEQQDQADVNTMAPTQIQNSVPNLDPTFLDMPPHIKALFQQESNCFSPPNVTSHQPQAGNNALTQTTSNMSFFKPFTAMEQLFMNESADFTQVSYGKRNHK